MEADVIRELKQENESLKRTCEILSDSQAIHSIQQSLKEIREGEYITLDEL
ncbi:MAG: hypothetical protein ACLFPL_04235 [Candidatus Nanoarchaeia archaeon]